MFIVLTVATQVCLHTRRWTAFNHLAYWGSIVVYFGLLVPYSVLPTWAPQMLGVFCASALCLPCVCVAVF